MYKTINVNVESLCCNLDSCDVYNCKMRKLQVKTNKKYALLSKITKNRYVIRYKNSHNLSGTLSCPYAMPRVYDCSQCRNCGYDSSCDGYCRLSRNLVVCDGERAKTDSNICKYFVMSDEGVQYDSITGEVIIK